MATPVKVKPKKSKVVSKDDKRRQKVIAWLQVNDRDHDFDWSVESSLSDLELFKQKVELCHWLNDNDCYELLWRSTDSLDRLQDCKNAVMALDDTIELAATAITIVAKRFKKVGIGDTDTDEAIVAEFYSRIH